MSGNKGGFAIGIGITDSASAGLDRINKRIQAMTAPAEKFNRSFKRFGEVTGINKAAEGMQAFGDRTLGAARALERMASPMALLTSAGSIAGVVALGNQWAETGNAVGKTANLLRTPVQQLGNLRIAAKLAGSSTEALDASMEGLTKTLSDARYNRPGNQMGLLEHVLHIDPRAADGTAKTANDVLDRVADEVKKRHADPTAQKLLLESLGMSADLIPLLDKGAAGLAEFKDRAAKTGGALTSGMVADATRMKSSWEELKASIEGVDNRIVDSWSGTATRIMDTTSHWIEKNKGLSDSYTKMGIGISTAMTALGAWNGAAWVLKAMFGYVIPTVSLAAGVGAGSALTLVGPMGGQPEGTDERLAEMERERQARGDSGLVGNWWMDHMPGWAGGGGTHGPAAPRLPGPRAGSSGGGAIDDATRTRAVSIHDGLVKRGMDSNTAWGFAGNSVQESRAMWNSRPGDMGAAHGAFMWRDSDDGGKRLTNYVNKWGHLPEQGSQDEQLDNVMYELNGAERDAWHKIQMSGNTPGERGAAVSQFYERPKDTADEESRRWGLSSDLAAGAQTGHVTVDVNIKGPPGTTANTTSRGAVIARPALIETSMPGAH
jgi:hypothetical protein